MEKKKKNYKYVRKKLGSHIPFNGAQYSRYNKMLCNSNRKRRVRKYGRNNPEDTRSTKKEGEEVLLVLKKFCCGPRRQLWWIRLAMEKHIGPEIHTAAHEDQSRWIWPKGSCSPWRVNARGCSRRSGRKCVLWGAQAAAVHSQTTVPSVMEPHWSSPWQTAVCEKLMLDQFLKPMLDQFLTVSCGRDSML